MDRRDFLKTTGAAAVAGGASASGASATDTQVPTPAVLSGSQRLMLVSYTRDLPGSAVDRLARRIETATEGRYRIELASGADADADLTYGSAWRQAGLHPAFAVFAGLPFSQGLDASSQQTWLAVGGGSMLWDELAAEHGFKPLVVGGTGPSSGVWSAVRLEAPSDLAGVRLLVEGLAGDALRDLGAAPPATLAPEELRGALADDRLQAAEWLGPLAAAAPTLQPLAQRLYQPGFNRHGQLLSLDIAKPLWDGLSAADQAIFEACAVEAYQLSLTEARAHALMAAQVETPGKWPLRLAWPSRMTAAFDQATAAAVERLAATDPSARRIHDSYQAFRRLAGEPATA
jgi:TRAP-type mannitol/chloroaromatic compound transport system substrate-binding protein